ncbi:MAG: hypothetical protein F6K37_09960 [Moorea sp. SIO4E2]|nr:hypothetical protein [Moorena sp. SIO4E2]NEQ06257.1 hypothetical protein [Moorena sp. SIO4E2]
MSKKTLLPRCAFRDGEGLLAITGRTAPDSRLPTPDSRLPTPYSLLP